MFQLSLGRPLSCLDDEKFLLVSTPLSHTLSVMPGDWNDANESTEQRLRERRRTEELTGQFL